MGVNPIAGVAELARRMGRSEAWVAGLLDAVDQEPDWSLIWNEREVPEGERRDYRDGFQHGLAARGPA